MRVNNEVEYTVSMKDLITGKIKAATAETKKLQTAVGDVKNSFNSIGGALGIGISVAGIVSFGKSVVESLKNYEYFSSSLRTLMHGDAETAKALETQLVALAKTTPFSLVEVQEATKQLLAYGFAAGDVTKNISMLGDVASALKIPFSDIAYLYGTLKTQGRAYTRDIMQFTSRGIPIIHELAKQYGVADSAIQKMVEDGKVGFPQVEKAFQSMTSEGGMFFNMMAQQNKTVGGQLSALGDSWEQLKVNIGKSQTGIIAETVSWANKLVSTFTEVAKSKNDMEEAFFKHGAEKLSWSDYLTFNKKGDSMKTELVRFQDALNQMYVETPASTIKAASEQFKSLTNLYKNQYKAFKEGDIDEKELDRRQAIIKNVMDQVKGNYNLLNEKASTTKKDNVTTTTSSIDPIKASAPKATQINITFGKLIEKQIVEVQNAGSNFVNRVGDETAQALLNALNDVNRIAAQ
jgi:hypothetical protein